jgi:hypothetical protein
MTNGRRSFLLPSIVIGFFLVTIQSCTFFDKRGASTREEVVSIYLQALEAKDEAAIQRLVPEDYAATEVIGEKVNRLGSRKLEQIKISYQELQKPSSLKVLIEGDYYDKPLPNGKKLHSTDQIFMHSAGNRWYLILGQPKKI